MKTSTNTRKAVRRRSKNRCEVCGTGGMLHDHHRRPRAMGGSTDPVSDSPANILRIHVKCHAKIEARRQWAVSMGYLVAQGVNPAEVRVHLHDGWFLLGHRGEAVPCKALR